MLVSALLMAGWACARIAFASVSSPATTVTARHAPFQGQSKCFDCEAALPAAADLYGNRCLDCEGPGFRYLDETIQTELGPPLAPHFVKV